MGLFSKIFKGIKKVIKGVVKGIKKVVKGVGKVVKKVAKSKIFKAILVAAAVYYTGGAFLHGAGVSGSGAFGTWAGAVGDVMATSGTFLSTVTKPFTMLGSTLGKGARALTDFTKITDPAAIAGGGENMTMIAGDGRVVDIYGNTVKTAAEVAAATAAAEEAAATAAAEEAAATAAAEEAAAAVFDPATGIYTSEATSETVKAAQILTRPKTRSKFVQGLGSWASNVAGSVASGYVLSELQGEDPAGAMFAGDIEGKRYFDPLQIYGMDGRPLDINSAYENLLYGNIDPFSAKDPLYTQATIPV